MLYMKVLMMLKEKRKLTNVIFLNVAITKEKLLADIIENLSMRTINMQTIKAVCEECKLIL